VLASTSLSRTSDGGRIGVESLREIHIPLNSSPAYQDSAAHARRDQEDDDGSRQGGGAEAPDAAAVACDAGEGHGEVRVAPGGGKTARNSSRGTGVLENAPHVLEDDDVVRRDHQDDNPERDCPGQSHSVCFVTRNVSTLLPMTYITLLDRAFSYIFPLM